MLDVKYQITIQFVVVLVVTLVIHFPDAMLNVRKI